MDDKLEIAKCKDSFEHFVSNWVKIVKWKKGLIPLGLYGFQKRWIETLDKNRFTIATKFRGGGFTTTTLTWLLWRCMFNLDQSICCISKTDREATQLHDMVETIIHNLPDWLRPQLRINNDHHIRFKDINCDMHFRSPMACRGLAFNYLFVDEAAFISNMDQHWKAMYPTLSCGGNAIIVSTPNGMGNWFEEIYHKAEQGKNTFYVFRADYTEHPDFQNQNWTNEMKAQLGDEGWRQEFLQEFLIS